MSLAPFHSRITDAIGPLVGYSAELNHWLASTAVCLEAPAETEESEPHAAGFRLAVNLCARLYPRIHLVGPRELVDECASLALNINPDCEIGEKWTGVVNAGLGWCTRSCVDNGVAVSPRHWTVLIDGSSAQEVHRTNSLTALCAGTLGVSEMFRTAFARFLSNGRTGKCETVFNSLTFDKRTEHVPELPGHVNVGRVHLAGAGAIGQAMIYALAALRVAGTLVIVDPETVTLSNLQRYVLSFNEDVGSSKSVIARRALSSSDLNVVSVESVWGDSDATTHGVETVCTALDTAAARIAIQAGLPRSVYNAWTQPADVGWSRHEHFGIDPCLACLYVPSRLRPSQHELIAQAVKQSELRVLAYLAGRLPVDVPLAPEQIPQVAAYPTPPDVSDWVERPILDDIASHLRLRPDEVKPWKGKYLADLYREGICGGAIVSDNKREIPAEFTVPLAHQSVLGGLMLAQQLVVSASPELREVCSQPVECRLDVLRPLGQQIVRPRKRTPNCICEDSIYVRRYIEKWRYASTTAF